MANLVALEKISLKNHPEIKEDVIQAYIFEHPEILGLGDLSAVKREKIQSSGGRLDMLLSGEDTRYEVEIQLGATDPSHIIRTIEYWDLERKRYPQYNHYAVIVAEEITGRFMNVISLFNGNIPLIALQISAFKSGDNILLTFTKVIDKIEYATEEEEEYEVKDRSYWETRSAPKVLSYVDSIYAHIKELAPGYELKYNKFYIGLSKDGLIKNFVTFRPRKNYIYMNIKGEFQQEFADGLDEAEIEQTYNSKWKEYVVRLDSYEPYKKNNELFCRMIKAAMEYFNID